MENNNINDIVKNYINTNQYTINKMEQGYSCKKWIVSSKGREKIFLKELKNTSNVRINFINYIQNSLNEYTPHIIKNKFNDTYIEKQDCYYIAYEFIDGTNLEKKIITLDEINEIGKFMGILHNKMKSIYIPEELTERTSLKIGDENIAKLIKLLRKNENKGNMNYVNIIKYKIDLLRKLPIDNIMNAKNNLSKQIVHGDFYLDNIIKTNETLIISDLDQVGIFYKMYEVIRGMMMIAYDEKDTNQYNIRKTVAFLEGYQKVNSIEDINISLDLYMYVLANSMYCLGEKDYENPEKRKYAIARCTMLKWMYENKKNIINEIRRSDIYYETTI